ncbi:MAG: hypothetical protein UR93_C0012G0002 [Berkelbacteria bacterium GW2011_GWA2_35_9]|uniref:HNH nuclease domain-containing protein n=1 Tax=Berkelbacteria bacterium GW2011_GWA2_35_9 TaxID=1618333 RepID=A0A0G0D2N9_9BACT|nr:MAG: hypothetical protein UR93_C0012G0002 [Berkelbacteria bacterium GW2011_GWA2_35_9]
MDYKLTRHRTDKISDAKVVAELKRVAEFYNFKKFTYHEFNKVSETCKGTTVLRIFGSWDKALEAIGQNLKERKTERTQIPTENFFREMDRIWTKLGHRPSKSEWEASSPQYSYSGIFKRFSGWTNACFQFVEWKMGKKVLDEKQEVAQKFSVEIKSQKFSTKRDIPLKLRLKVLQRDNFCCAFCGKSPATDHGTVLHIDHIKPYSKGGETELDNLQTLCQKCNWGKSNDE